MWHHMSYDVLSFFPDFSRPPDFPTKSHGLLEKFWFNIQVMDDGSIIKMSKSIDHINLHKENFKKSTFKVINIPYVILDIR